MTRPGPGLPVPDPAGALPPDETVARFRQDLAALWPELDGRDEPRLGIAVSGGPDSLALLLLAHAALPGRIAAATVDHRLRTESAAEAAMVGELCLALGVPHAVLPVDVPPGNVQASAREARYAALTGWAQEGGLSALASAHHADDQAETLLMRLNRASGAAGLAGARGRGLVPGGGMVLLRPLLAWRRSELAHVVAACGLRAVDDPSNGDDRFDRARLRKRLADCDWLDIAAIAQSAGHLADADAAIAWAAGREWHEAVRREGPSLIYRPQAPRAVALRVLARIAGELGGPEPRGSALARAFESLLSGKPCSLGDLTARPMAGEWHFTPAPKRRR